MKKVFLFALACMAAVSAQAKEPKWFLNEKPLPEKHILATSSLDSIVVQKSDGSIHAWAEKGIEWKPLVELVSPKLQSRHVAENLYFSVDGPFTAGWTRSTESTSTPIMSTPMSRRHIFPGRNISAQNTGAGN